jgi:TP901 family phage tail tape measure protein
MADYSISAEIKADTGSFTKGINDCEKSLNGFQKSLEGLGDKITTGLQSWGVDFGKFYKKGSDFFKKFGLDIDLFASRLGMSGPVLAGITACTVALTKMGQEMNSAVGEIAKGTGATGKDLQELEQSFKNVLSGGVKADMQQVGVMIAEINTRFGSTGKELEKLTDQFDMFSTVTGVDTKEAIDGVADVMAKWGIETKDTKKLLDQLTKAGQHSGISIQTLMNSLKNGKTVFAQFGMSTTKSIAFLETLAKAGVNTETAMQGMKYALNKFATEGKNAEQAFKEVGDAIKQAGSDSEALQIAIENFGSKAGAEMINVFRNGAGSIEEFEKALREAGGTLEETEENTRTSKEAWKEFLDSLKSMFGSLGQGLDHLFRDIIDSITSIVRFLTPVIQPIADIIGDLFTYIGKLIKTFVNAIVEFQQKYNFVFQALVNVLNNTRNAIRKILQNLADIFSNLFGFIDALLNKKWNLAWEYAKNSLLKFVDGVLSAFDWLVKSLQDLINPVIKLINGIISGYNAVAGFLKKPLAEPIKEITDEFKSADLLGITKMIQDSDAKIAELTGKTSKKIIGDLGAIQNTAEDVTQTITDNANATAENISKWEDKLRNQQIERLESEKENAVIRAENEKKTEEEIFRIKESYDYKIRALKEEGIRKEMNAELAKAKTTEEKAKIEIYYLNEISKLYEKKIERLKEEEEQKKKNSQWDGKLLSQTIQLLEAEENETVQRLENEKKTQGEIFKVHQSYGTQILALKKKQLEEQHKADLEGVDDAEEIAKINLYYQTELTKLVIDENNKRRFINKENDDVNIKEEESTFDKMLDIAKTYVANVGAVFSNIKNVLSNIWSGVVSIIGSAFNMLKSAFNTVKNFMDKLFNFDPTETLTNMLEYEDKILTFFTFTMQKIPAFVESALSSIGVLMDKLLSQVDLTQVAKIIEDVINTFAKLAPKIIKQIAKLFTDLVKTAGKVIAQNSDVIVGAIGDIVMTVLDNLPTILKTLATVILTLVKSIGTYINNNAGQIIQDLTDLITGIVSAIADFVNNGGWKVLLNAVLNVFYALNRSIIDNIPSIVDTIIKMLPDIVNAIVAIIVEINKSSTKILKPIARLVVKIVSSIIDILTNPDMIESAVEVAIALLEAVMTEIIPQLPKLVIQLVKGLILAFAKINWMSVVKDIFKAFINGIKSLFGIHSPSTLFQSFGSMMVQGLVNGLKNIWGNVSGIFSNLVGNIGNVFSNIGSVIGNAMSKIFDNVSSWVGSIGNKLSSIGSGISSAMGKVGGAISSGVGKVKSFLGFATGTVSAPSGLAVVGERGPELVNFKGGEQVINDRDTRKVLAGGNNTSNSFNITFNNTSQTTAYTVMREMKKYGRELAFNGVL